MASLTSSLYFLVVFQVLAKASVWQWSITIFYSNKESLDFQAILRSKTGLFQPLIIFSHKHDQKVNNLSIHLSANSAVILSKWKISKSKQNYE